MTIFMDTFGLIAWINTRDAAYQPVKSYLDGYSGSIVTTEWVLLEFADAFSRSSVKPTAIEAIKRIRRLPMFLVVGFLLLSTKRASTFSRLGQTRTGR